MALYNGTGIPCSLQHIRHLYWRYDLDAGRNPFLMERFRDQCSVQCRGHPAQREIRDGGQGGRIRQEIFLCRGGE